MVYYWGLFANAQVPGRWTSELENTDFLKSLLISVKYFPVVLRKMVFHQLIIQIFDFADERTEKITDRAPVIGVIINGKARVYPFSILTWHEIINDKLGGIPITVTYCPLCNSSFVFDRRLEERLLGFGTTGKLRRSNIVMYDRQSES